MLTGIDDWSRLRFSRHGLQRLGRGRVRPSRRARARPIASELAAGDRHRRRRRRRRQGRLPGRRRPRPGGHRRGRPRRRVPAVHHRSATCRVDAHRRVRERAGRRGADGRRSRSATPTPKPATGVVVAITPPAGVTVDTPRWEVGEVPARGAKHADACKVTGTTVGRGDLDGRGRGHERARLRRGRPQASKRLTVFEPGAVRTALDPRPAPPARATTAARRSRVRIDVEGSLRHARSRAGCGRSAARRRRARTTSRRRPGHDLPVLQPRRRSPSRLIGDTLDEADETIELELQRDRRRAARDGARRRSRSSTTTRRASRASSPTWAASRATTARATRATSASPSSSRRAGQKALTPDGRFLWVADARVDRAVHARPGHGRAGRREVLGHARSRRATARRSASSTWSRWTCSSRPTASS